MPPTDTDAHDPDPVDLSPDVESLIETYPAEAHRETVRTYALEERARETSKGTVLNRLRAVRDLASELLDLETDDGTPTGLRDATPFEDMTRRDARRYAARDGFLQVKRVPDPDGGYALRRREKTVADSTRTERYKDARRFLRWAAAPAEALDFFDTLDLTRGDGGGPRDLSRDDLLTREEVRQLMQAAANPRDRALVALLAEAGLRRGEAASLRVRDLSFRDGYAQVRLPEDEDLQRLLKRGPRSVVVTDCDDHLAAWLEDHPRADDPEAQFFCDLRDGSRIQPESVSDVVKRLARRSGLEEEKERGVWAHLLRHSAVTNARREGRPDHEVRAFFGFSETSPVIEEYSHLVEEDHRDLLLQHRGIREGEEAEARAVAAETCPRCEAKNPADAVLCEDCRAPLRSAPAEDVREAREDRFRAMVGEAVAETMARMRAAEGRPALMVEDFSPLDGDEAPEDLEAWDREDRA